MSNIQTGNSFAYYGDFAGFAYGDRAYKAGRQYQIQLKNAELTENNKIVSPRGYEQRSTAAYNTYRIREILQFRRSGLDCFLLFGTDANGLAGGIAKVTDTWTNAPVVAEVKVLTDFDTDAVLLQFNDLAYLFNGVDDQFYDGTTWYDIGTTAPVTAPTLTLTIAGSMNTASTYTVGWGWYDSVNKRRSNVSPLLTTSTGANTGLRIGLPVVAAPAGYDQRVIYCTNAYGNQLFEDQYVAAATVSVDITQSDAVRATLFLYEGNYDAPSTFFNVAVVANGKIYGGDFNDAKCRIYRSKVSAQFGPMPQSFPPLYFTDAESNASDKLLGLGVVGSQENQTVIVVKEKSFGKILKINEDLEIYQKLGDVGGYGQKSIFSIGTLCGFVSEAGIVITDGSTFKKVGGSDDGEGIADFLQTLSLVQKKRFYATNITNDKQIRISCVTSGQSWNDLVLYGHYGQYEAQGIIKWTTREFGPDKTTYPGIHASSMKEVLDYQNKFRVLYGDSQASGKLFEGDVGSTDNGGSIFQEWIFKPENFGDPLNEKIFNDLLLRFRAADQSTTVSILYQKNLAKGRIFSKSKTVSGSGFVFGQSQFGLSVFTNSPIFEMIVPFHVRARELAVVLRTTNQIELIDFVMNRS